MIFKPSHQPEAVEYLCGLFEKQKTVKIDPVTESKTLSQVRYCWLCFTHIAYETGNTKEDIYAYFLNKFPTIKEISINGNLTSVMISLSQFTENQCSYFIDRFVIDARQEGFDLPDPEDRKAVQMYNYYKNLGTI